VQAPEAPRCLAGGPCGDGARDRRVRADFGGGESSAPHRPEQRPDGHGAGGGRGASPLEPGAPGGDHGPRLPSGGREPYRDVPARGEPLGERLPGAAVGRFDAGEDPLPRHATGLAAGLADRRPRCGGRGGDHRLLPGQRDGGRHTPRPRAPGRGQGRRDQADGPARDARLGRPRGGHPGRGRAEEPGDGGDDGARERGGFGGGLEATARGLHLEFGQPRNGLRLPGRL
ncbi:MAG: Membrane proteins related to metalloendopeptidases, partial [uncultured Rubrobacteraceae bacterium]